MRGVAPGDTQLQRARAVTEYLRDFSDSIAALPGAEVVDLGRFRAVFSHRRIFNRIYQNEYPATLTPDDVVRGARVARSRMLQPVWIVDERGLPPESIRTLASENFSRTATWIGMARDFANLSESPAPEHVAMRFVETPADLAVWARICAEVESYSDDQQKTFLELFERLGRRQWTHAIADLQGEPVAAASLFVTGRIAALDWVSTLEPARGRGIAGYLCRRLLELARGRCDLAVLTSTPIGERIYRKLGFIDCARIASFRMT